MVSPLPIVQEMNARSPISVISDSRTRCGGKRPGTASELWLLNALRLVLIKMDMVRIIERTLGEKNEIGGDNKDDHRP
jgi:hypothetical protein